MKFSLALVLVSLSVLTAAKHEFVRKANGKYNPSPNQPGGNAASPSGVSANGASPANAQPQATPASSTSGKSSSGWVQNPNGKASFTVGSGCQAPACGQKVTGYSAAVNELAYGANSGTGGACGRCFKITPTSDPNTPSSTGPFGNSIVIKVNDLCTASSNSSFCGQTVSTPLNDYKMPMHFELCTDSGAPGAFFPDSKTVMLGTHEEVECSEWSGSDGEKTSDTSCMSGEGAGLWPNTGCGNSGTPPA